MEVHAALKELPGWEAADVKRLKGGLTNTAYLLEAGERRAVLKIDTAVREIGLNERGDEARIQTLAASAGLAPKVLHASQSLYLSEYVEGTVWTRSDLQQTDNLVELAVALKTLHGLPLTGRLFDPVAAAESYFDRLADADPANAQRCMRTIREMPAPAHLCCCHNDLIAENVVYAGGVRFIDWEYACDNDPFFDLATIVAQHRLSTTQAGILLDAYFDGEGADWREQLARQEGLYESLAWLWRESRRTA